MSTNRWALISYGHYWLADVLHIFLTTNRPINLSVTFTDTQPVYYPTGKIVRGEGFLADPHYRFINATELPQTEPGDTLNHTFTIPGWTQGLKRWWYFDGTIGGMPTISNSGFIHAQAYDQQEAFTMRHLDLTDKEAAGIIDHADGSVTPAKLVSPFNFTAFPLTPSAWPTQDYEVANKEYVDLNHTDHKWLGTWIDILNAPGETVTTPWTEIDLSAIIPSQTAQVYLSLYMNVRSYAPPYEARLRVRDPDLTTNRDYIPDLWFHSNLGHGTFAEHAIQQTISPNSQRKIEWKLDTYGTILLGVHIHLQGYTYYKIP